MQCGERNSERRAQTQQHGGSTSAAAVPLDTDAQE